MRFAYRARTRVEDAQMTLLNLLYNHLEGLGTHARLISYVLAKKLLTNFSLDRNLVGWITDFLTNRSQGMKVNGCLSGRHFSSTGSPQGCVLSPLLYILYTNDCRSQLSGRHIMKFADDTVIASLHRKEKYQHGPVVDEFVSWCEESFLQLNTSKTKDMVIDFRRNPPCSPPLTHITGSCIKIV